MDIKTWIFGGSWFDGEKGNIIHSLPVRIKIRILNWFNR